MTDLRFLNEGNIDTVAGLVMELAAQLHEERAQRIALQTALEEAGVLDASAVESLSQAAQERIRAQLDSSVSGLVRLMTESGPPEHPIRDEARDDAWAVEDG